MTAKDVMNVKVEDGGLHGDNLIDVSISLPNGESVELTISTNGIVYVDDAHSIVINTALLKKCKPRSWQKYNSLYITIAQKRNNLLSLSEVVFNHKRGIPYNG